jgi:hypothetical protein
MGGHDGIVVKGLDTQIGQGIDTEVLLGHILHIAHIGIDAQRLQVLHVVVETYHVSLIVHTQIECAAGGGVEEAAADGGERRVAPVA